MHRDLDVRPLIVLIAGELQKQGHVDSCGIGYNGKL
jgi:hypothetical protein